MLRTKGKLLQNIDFDSERLKPAGLHLEDFTYSIRFNQLF
ncbi:hypothetical protein M595_2203 [Lyngbya aestuarii BL J]|uniref:Uncharacterized protein n=1 Tax=Lyngbya aestuarii BL J TaxID=1348334 RepID=U7QKM7_9CYAN|nr:hypothetical protein M595_2203 [Lyngbya aestuarii BL J]